MASGGTKHRGTPPRGGHGDFPGRSVRAFDLESWLVALLVVQMVWFVMVPTEAVNRLVGIVLGIASVALARGQRDTGRGRLLLGTLAALSQLNLIFAVLAFTGPVPLRLLVVVAMLGSIAVVIAWTVGQFTSVSFTKAIPVVMTLVLVVTLWELLLSANKTSSPIALSQVIAPAPAGLTYTPNTTATTEYPENPRGYFLPAGTDQSDDWFIVAVDSSHAGELSRSDENPETMRVRVDRVGRRDDWRLRLEHRGIHLQRSAAYRLTFRVRASAPRPMRVGIWSNLLKTEDVGLASRAFPLDTAWRGFSESFRATATDTGAVLLFHLGHDSADVELASVAIVDAATGISAKHGTSARFVVRYRFDSLGCRGPGYTLTRTPGTVRVLSLGGSSALGAGVHEEDTYAARLTRALNDAPPGDRERIRYEVINCGIAGHGVAEVEQLYVTLGRRFSPDIVLLSLVAGDDQDVTQDPVAQGYSAFEYVFKSLARYRDWRAARMPMKSIDQAVVRSLGDSIQADGARLALMVFDDAATSAGLELEQAARALENDTRAVLWLSESLRPIGRRDRVVHERLDAGPNDVAHRIAARELIRFLRAKELLSWAEARVADSVAGPRAEANRDRRSRIDQR